jgi:hypothetical protein
MGNKTQIKEKKTTQFRKKRLHTKKKDRKNKLKLKQKGGINENKMSENYNQQQPGSNNENFSQYEGEEEFEEQPGELQTTQPPNNEHALVGIYNNPEKSEKGSILAENIEKSRGGLFVPYPPPMNTNKETSLKLKLKDKREEGFTDFKGQPDDQLEPKFLTDGFYPKNSIYNELKYGVQANSNQEPESEEEQEFGSNENNINSVLGLNKNLNNL